LCFACKTFDDVARHAQPARSSHEATSCHKLQGKPDQGTTAGLVLVTDEDEDEQIPIQDFTHKPPAKKGLGLFDRDQF
jgi:hypothetical protein